MDNYQRLNYNVVRIHQEPGSPYMLDVADEMGLMIIDEVAIRGSQSSQEWQNSVGRDNMVNHARALVLRDRNHPRSSAGVRTTSRTRAARIPNSSRRICTRR
ncbi:glycoside hydrolase family 2 TIM barrel-domain containing protein [Micromonospora sp. M12]